MSKPPLAKPKENQILIDLSKPKDEWLLRIMLDGPKWNLLVKDLDRELRSMVKYWDMDRFKANKLDCATIDWVRKRLHEFMNEEGLRLDE